MEARIVGRATSAEGKVGAEHEIGELDAYGGRWIILNKE